MSQTLIPDSVKRFILLHIPSVPYLEAMLLLRDHASQAWDYQQVSQRLYLSDNHAKSLLAELEAGGVLIADENPPTSYHYHPKTQLLREEIDRLATIYTKNLVEVSNLIHAKTNKKAQQFADAFIWRKDKQ